MTELYPEVQPISEHYLEVSDLHKIHYELCGNPKGKPVLFVHGGPGGGIDPSCRRFFNPELYFIVLVNQRGSGLSTPHAELNENTTQHLINDFELVRQACGIEQWMLFGGSWGSTLSLAYSQEHPDRVTELVLRGIFLGTERECQWLFGGQGANYVFPDYWQSFVDLIPKSEQDNLLLAYYNRLTSDSTETIAQAALAFSRWEYSISMLQPDLDAVDELLATPVAMSLARLECHYMYHQCFLKPNQLLDGLDKIKHIPTYIVHGRYDMVCAPRSAWILHSQLPGSQLSYVTAGHSLKDPEIAKELVRITNAIVGITD